MTLLSTTTWSYQLQFNFKFRKSRTPFLYTKDCQLRHGHHLCRHYHLKVKCVAQNEAKASTSNESVAQDEAKTSTSSNDSSMDAVKSDWFGSSDSSNNGGNGIGGILGVGLAGVLLFAGITSAAISIGKRSSSRSVPEMKPIVEQEEILPTSEEKINDESNVENDNQTESKLSNEDDLSSSLGPTEDIKEDAVIESLSTNEKSAATGPAEKINEDTVIESLSVDEESSATGPSLSDVNDPDTISSPDLTEIENVGEDNVTDAAGLLVTEEENVVENNVEGGAGLLGTEEQQETLKVTQEDAYNGLESSDSQNLESSDTSNVVLEAESLTLTSGDLPVVDSVVSGEDNELGSQTESLTLARDDLPVVDSVSGEDNELNRSLELPIENSNTLVDEQVGVFRSEAAENFTARGIPAPSLLSRALEPGKVLVPAVTGQTQSQALTALQVLKVIESDAQPGDLCTRREYARWLISASGALSRNVISKVYPAMYIENVTELAFDDITPEDPDFASIQGLAEAGLISSKLSKRDMLSSPNEDIGSFDFHPNSALSRQDLVTWKMALEKRELPEADKKVLHQISGFIDIDRIDLNACPALVADLSAPEQGIVALAFGYTRLFQPDKPVTKGQVAIALTTGEATEVVNEELARIEAESIAEKEISTYNALVAEIEKDINANFEKELLMEREKVELVQKMAEEAKEEVEKLKAEREEKNIELMKQRAATESEMEVLSRLRGELEEQLQSVMTNKVEISYEKERIEKLRKEAEEENQAIIKLQYELEVERKALSMARTWAEDEAKRVQEYARSLEEARDRWESKGLKVQVSEDLQEEASPNITWTNVGKNLSVENTVERAENLTDKLKLLASEVGGKSREIVDTIIQKIESFISAIKEWISNAGKRTNEFRDVAVVKVGGSIQELQENAATFGTTFKEGAKRVVGDCREGVEKLTQRFKTA